MVTAGPHLRFQKIFFFLLRTQSSDHLCEESRVVSFTAAVELEVQSKKITGGLETRLTFPTHPSPNDQSLSRQRTVLWKASNTLMAASLLGVPDTSTALMYAES